MPRAAFARAYAMEMRLLAVYRRALDLGELLSVQRRRLLLCCDDHQRRARWLEKKLERWGRRARTHAGALFGVLAWIVGAVRGRSLLWLLEVLERRATERYAALVDALGFELAELCERELLARQRFTAAKSWHAVHAFEAGYLSDSELAAPAASDPRARV